MIGGSCVTQGRGVGRGYAYKFVVGKRERRR